MNEVTRIKCLAAMIIAFNKRIPIDDLHGIGSAMADALDALTQYVELKPIEKDESK